MKHGNKLVQGFGINDADYTTSVGKSGGPIKRCPYYARWVSMISRCFSEAIQEKQPTYYDKTICEDWRYFSKFKEWMSIQIWQGLDLDKDILVIGNKEYGPGTCAFVPPYINTLLGFKRTAFETYPLGVCYEKKTKHMVNERTNPYRAVVNKDGKQKKIGLYSTPMEAHRAWQLAKAEEIERQILRYMLEPCYRQDIANALYLRVENLRNDAEDGIETKIL